ncbi:hypothetical protein LVJ94_35010 [Pendulispora rubella]|uniref:Uncharacterized protein n=1 Tax=Pendulispora rubella TaxID=2741070 RepID=A0ABZ2L0J1_9BACT
MLLGTYREGVVAGMQQATGDPSATCAEFDPRSWRDIERALRAHGPPDAGEEQQIEWLRSKAVAYVIATHSKAQFQRGFHPVKFVEWCNERSLCEASAPSVAAAPRQQYSDPTAPWLKHEREAS